MYLLENPVLQRELLVNLRTLRSFALLLGYNALLGVVVVLAWPREARLNLGEDPEKAKNLVNLFFLGQYLLISMMSPSFAAGAITGEKERKTYESLLASPLHPAAIVLGKLLASLAILGVLMFTSLPIVMLCLPLGGVSLYEVLAVYMGLIMSVTLFGMISIACSSYFSRSSSALVVSYLLILPLSLLGILIWNMFPSDGVARLFTAVTVFPAISIVLTGILFRLTQQRLLHPPDVGSEGKEVIDTDNEVKKAVGLVIHRDRFPDNLFAPAKRHTLMPEHINPVYDKEMRSEIFAQGTLMLRVVIQVSMFLALPLMGICLFVKPEWSTWYISYVVLFNMLVGPVFSASSITSERERETLDLLLTTILSPAQILWGKLFSGLRVSSVLTAFLLWPLILAAVLTGFYWKNWIITIAYLVIVGLSCLVTSSLGLFCSVFFKKSATSMMTAYMAIIALFCFPVALSFFAETFFPGTALAETVNYLGVISPFTTIFHLPMEIDTNSGISRTGDISLFLLYVSFTAFMVASLWGVMIWLFNLRWRVAN